MKNQKKKSVPIGVFPAPTLSQLETILDDRQNNDRRSNTQIINFEERRQKQRRSKN